MKPLTPTTPHLILMMGIPGAGKTHFAEHFAKTFHAPFVNTQALQEIADTDNEQATALSDSVLDEILKTQKTTVYEGPTHTRGHRIALSEKAKAAGYRPLIVWVQTDTIAAKQRAVKSGHHTAATFDEAIQRFQAPQPTEKPIVMSGKHTYASQLKIVLRHLAGTQSDQQPPQAPRARSGRNIVIQ